ncbi:MAG: hypothetical protein WCZ18_08575 [Ottowia sp.]|nr:hypothetical protein [Ottowia sp.]
MRTENPFASLADAFSRGAGRLRPPQWLVQEMQHRLVLFLNHVLQQEPQAMERLAGQSGRVVRVAWRDFWMQLAVTPAGLCELAPDAGHDLLVEVAGASPFELGRDLARGVRPAIRIAGDVDFAAEVNWLVDHVRWDAEEDLSRLVGDAPAHALAAMGQSLARALRRFAGGAAGRNGDRP